MDMVAGGFKTHEVKSIKKKKEFVEMIPETVFSSRGYDCQLIQASLFRNRTVSVKPSSFKDCRALWDAGNTDCFIRFMFSKENWEKQKEILHLTQSHTYTQISCVYVLISLILMMN